ncbi:hypothetical protein [Microlunatus sp. GCM10028923]|uniref:hypothetical protein n=1 Tax=Microlunatus sp. GCM10028923 TaxID=3273400 RepID=UPI003611E573
MGSARGNWAGFVVLAAVLIGLLLLIIPPIYSSDVNRVDLSCGVPLLFNEDDASREARRQDVPGETALLIGAECHERVTGRIAGAVLAGLVAVGTLGITNLTQGRRRSTEAPQD